MDGKNAVKGREYHEFIAKKRLFVFALAVALVLVFLMAVALGSSSLPLGRVLATLFGQGENRKTSSYGTCACPGRLRRWWQASAWG